MLSSMSDFSASVQRTNLDIMSRQTGNTPSGITTFLECSVMPTLRQPMKNSCRDMFTEDSTCIDKFPVYSVTSQRPTSSIQCRLPCLTTFRRGFSTSWRHMNSSTTTIQSGYPSLLTATSQQKFFVWGSIAMEWKRDSANEPVPG
jgi:hypothetical protein